MEQERKNKVIENEMQEIMNLNVKKEFQEKVF